MGPQGARNGVIQNIILLHSLHPHNCHKKMTLERVRSSLDVRYAVDTRYVFLEIESQEISYGIYQGTASQRSRGEDRQCRLQT